MKHKVAELEGALLDFAVARAERHLTMWQEGESVVGRAVHTNDGIGAPLGVVGGSDDQRRYSPSTDWAQGGPIIERERIIFLWLRGWWYAEWKGGPQHREYLGPTALVAAMRAYVAGKLGDEVELP